jgi:translation initiation factor 5B
VATTADEDPDAGAGSLRTPIVAVLGHVDHGKTTLLDEIRGSTVAGGEAGAITQHIGATHVPLDTIATTAGRLVDPDDFDLPGLLFIDTPGHHAFATLRSRGGALADIAVLVVDVTDGMQPQTLEAIEILDRTETPFVVAANKIDTIPGWTPSPDEPIQGVYEGQSDRVRERLDEHLYELVGELSDADFAADVYWRVSDFRDTVGVVPISAETGDGVADLLTVLMGLSQRYLREAMSVDVTGPGSGTVLEVAEEQGFGTTLDLVLADGRIREDDRIVVGGEQGPIETTVRALLKPQPLAEMRTEGEFAHADEVAAAAGIKVAAPDLDDAMAGGPLRVVGDRPIEEVREEVAAELAAVAVETDDEGVVVKADTLGSLEAVADALRDAEIPIMRAEVGAVAPRDVTVASTADPKRQAILGFGVEVLDEAAHDAEEAEVEVFADDVIYRLVEAYEEYVEAIERDRRGSVLENVIRPARFRVLQDHVFRQNDPAVVGVEVLGGTLHRNVPVCLFDGAEPERVGVLQGLQHEGDDVDEARAGERVSAAIDGPTIGRDVEEGDELWVHVPEKHVKVLETELLDDLPADEREALSQYAEQHRNRDPFWGK